MQVGGVMSSTHRAFDAQTDVEHVVKQPLRRERRESTHQHRWDPL